MTENITNESINISLNYTDIYIFKPRGNLYM